jgi:hypothetical protein
VPDQYFSYWSVKSARSVFLILECQECQISVSHTGVSRVPDQCFSYWSVKSAKRRKCIMAKGSYWRSKICMYELKLEWRYSTLIVPSLLVVTLGIYCKQRRHGVCHFEFLNSTTISIFYFLKHCKMHRKVTIYGFIFYM